MAAATAKRANPQTIKTIYRVYKIGESTRNCLKVGRESAETTNQKYLEMTVAAELPKLVDKLTNLFAMSGVRRPARLPLSRSLIDTLNQASGTVGIPATKLLVACLHLGAEGLAVPRSPTPKTAKVEKTPKKAKKASPVAPKATKGKKRPRTTKAS